MTRSVGVNITILNTKLGSFDIYNLFVVIYLLFFKKRSSKCLINIDDASLKFNELRKFFLCFRKKCGKKFHIFVGKHKLNFMFIFKLCL